MKKTDNRLITAALMASIVTLSACSNEEAADIIEALNIKFAAQVNGQDFACSPTPNTGVGTGAHDYKVEDFRLYVHDVHIHDHDSGEEYPIALTQDGMWQYEDVAMLDFEDGTNGCVGTAEMNTEVKGQVTIPPTLDLATTEVCFEVGLPADKNHIDTLGAAPPLDSIDMLWAWKLGRKYVKIDGVGDPSGVAEPFKLHLGAQGCPAGAGNAPPVTACTVPNTFEVCVDHFDVDNDVIAIDPAFVFEANDISTNLSPNGMGSSTPKPGCQSFIDDLDCEEIMPRLGLDYTYGRVGIAGAPSAYNGGQRLFSKQ